MTTQSETPSIQHRAAEIVRRNEQYLRNMRPHPNTGHFRKCAEETVSVITELEREVTALTAANADLTAQLAEARRDGYVSVPRHLVERASVLLQSVSEYGINTKWADGTETPNAKLCRDTHLSLDAAMKEPK